MRSPWRNLGSALAVAIPLAIALGSGLGCATTAGPPGADHRPTAGDSAASCNSKAHRIMVTFALQPAVMWKRAVDELANNYELEVLFRWPLESLGQECVVFGLPANRSAEEIVTRVQTDPRVRLAQPIYRFRVLSQPPHQEPARHNASSVARGPSGYNDPHSHLQHGLTTTHIDAAHTKATGRGVKIAIIDTGVDVTHPDLEGRVVQAKSFVQDEPAFTTDIHGTAVAGVIAAGANNRRGIVGVAPGAELLALKACWQDPPEARSAICDSYTLAQAIDFAINEGAQVVNFSLTGPQDPLLAVLIDKAIERGITVLAAADKSILGGFPASHAGVLAVRGCGIAQAAPGESPVTDRELAAPSTDILSTAPSDSYDFFSGSSLAVAQVSGIAALLLEIHPNLKPTQVAALIRKTAHPIEDSELLSENPPLALVDAKAALDAAIR